MKTPQSDGPDREGSTESFDQNWQKREEAEYNHWTPESPDNQIQLVFRNHWEVFSRYLEEDGITEGKCLEVGCGRGTISSFFAENNYDCHLLDTSTSVLETARTIFSHNGHDAELFGGDATKLPFEGNSFDVIMSIGLLEHFEDTHPPLREQARVLRPGGRFFGYVVPENERNIQRYFDWVNTVLNAFFKSLQSDSGAEKAEVFRTDYGSERYVEPLEAAGVIDIEAMGMYPLPMISHSPEFPFTLLPDPLERVYVRLARGALYVRGKVVDGHPWTCREKMGQAFVVTGIKTESGPE